MTSNKNDKDDNYLMLMLDKFDKKTNHKSNRYANIVLMQIPNRQKDIEKSQQVNNQSFRTDDVKIVGGYASDAWSADK